MSTLEIIAAVPRFNNQLSCKAAAKSANRPVNKAIFHRVCQGLDAMHRFLYGGIVMMPIFWASIIFADSRLMPVKYNSKEYSSSANTQGRIRNG